MTDNMMTAQYTSTDQFMPATPGLGTAGKNMNVQATDKKQRAMMLIGVPHLPRSNREAGNGSPRKRFVSMQAMQMMYEESSPVSVSVVKMKKAVDDPITITDSTMVKHIVTL